MGLCNFYSLDFFIGGILFNFCSVISFNAHLVERILYEHMGLSQIFFYVYVQECFVGHQVYYTLLQAYTVFFIIREVNVIYVLQIWRHHFIYLLCEV